MTIPPPLPELALQALNRTVEHFMLRRPASWDPDPRDLFDLAAPYQRGSVWTVEQQRALIRSLVIGLPVGAVLTSALNPEGRGPSYRVVDGKQRIETVRAWTSGRLEVPCWWFQPEDIDGPRHAGMVTWDGLTESGRRRFGNQSMAELHFDGSIEWLGRGENGRWRTRRRSAAEVLAAEAELFGLVNGAGTPQTAEDMARAAMIAGQ
jgi:hypothetical protein